MGTNERVIRLIKLGQAIAASKHGLVIEQYARNHGYSRSALYRDLKVLRECSFPIISRDRRHFLPADFRFFGRGGFDANELLALNAMRLLANRLPGSHVAQSLNSLWRKVADPGVERLALPRISAFASIDYAPHRKTIETLEQAVHDRQVVRLHYRRTNGEVTRREFEPHDLHADASVEGLYVIGYCRLRRAIRTFAVHRVSRCKPTGEVFTVRHELRSHQQLRSAFRAWMSDHPLTKVELRFSALVSEEIAERRLHPSQVNKPMPGGGLQVTLTVSEPASLIRWLMGFGPDVEVLEPEDLRLHISARHQASRARSPEGIDTTIETPTNRHDAVKCPTR